jgi:hypothetical protein
MLWEVQTGTTNVQNNSLNFHFNFIPKELLYMKNNSSKYELNLSAAKPVPCAEYSSM